MNAWGAAVDAPSSGLRGSCLGDDSDVALTVDGMPGDDDAIADDDNDELPVVPVAPAQNLLEFHTVLGRVRTRVKS